MRRRDLVVLVLLALAIRALYLAQLAGYELADVLILDPRAYDAEAMRILSGESFPHAFYQAPLYSYLLAGIYTLFGRSFDVVRIFQMLLGAVTVALTADFAGRLFGRSAGILAGILALAYGVFPYYEGQIMKTSLTVFLSTLLLWTLEPSRKGALSDRRSLLAGLLLGLAVLTRENLLLFLPVGALVLYRQTRGFRAPILFAAAAAAAIAPAAIHNLRASGELIAVTSQGGQNFYIGNHRAATGTYANPDFVRPDPLYERSDFAAEAQRRAGTSLTANEVSSYWYEQALGQMLSGPLRAVKLFGRKVLIFFEGVERPDNDSLYVLRGEAPLLRALSLSFAVFAPLGLLGAYVARRRAGELLMLHAFFAVNLVALVLFFVVSRYRVVVTPLLMIFAAPALLALASWARERRVGAVAIAVALLLAATAVMSVPDYGGQDPRDYRTVNFHINRGRIYRAAGRLDEALAHYRDALAEAPEVAFIRFELADVLYKTGNGDEALVQMLEAIRIRPEFPSARNDLGILYAERGDYAAAEREFREAARLQPDWRDPLVNLVRLYDTVGDGAGRETAQAALVRLDASKGTR